ncbi:hypothetical protein PIB30_085590 [Stylosanthes scabra]|uniref:Uncharacterized protein n=1 Tax=Stylosanthes scabra TaxID=79078 RepID=A0ABU6UTQ3_9FABA|nr:hypothetical protein [Stylosanthes scabra]
MGLHVNAQIDFKKFLEAKVKISNANGPSVDDGAGSGMSISDPFLPGLEPKPGYVNTHCNMARAICSPKIVSESSDIGRERGVIPRDYGISPLINCVSPMTDRVVHEFLAGQNDALSGETLYQINKRASKNALNVEDDEAKIGGVEEVNSSCWVKEGAIVENYDDVEAERSGETLYRINDGCVEVSHFRELVDSIEGEEGEIKDSVVGSEDEAGIAEQHGIWERHSGFSSDEDNSLGAVKAKGV